MRHRLAPRLERTLLAAWFVFGQACESKPRAQPPKADARLHAEISRLKADANPDPEVFRLPSAPLLPPQHCGCSDSDPSRDGFFCEALFPAASARTQRFDDYTPGSYHVNKFELAQGLPLQAARCGIRLKAMLAFGPIGPLWAYHIATLVDDGLQTRVNSLVMPHARIIGKRTGTLSKDEATSLLNALQAASLMQPGPPVASGTALEGEFSYQALLTLYDGPVPQYFHAAFAEYEPTANDRLLLDRANALLRTTTTDTYTH